MLETKSSKPEMWFSSLPLPISIYTNPQRQEFVVHFLIPRNMPTMSSEQPRHIARRLPPAAIPVDAITAPQTVRILLTADIPNSHYPPVVLVDDDVQLSARVEAGHMSGPFYRES